MAARIGWNTVYSTLQLSRLRRLFEQRQKGPEDNDRGTFDDWNECRTEDGILCRDSEDCVWIDSNLYCDESGLNFTPEPEWFGGDASSISGSCKCSGITTFNDSKDAMSCETAVMPVVAITVFSAIAVIVSCYYVVRCVFRRIADEESFDEDDSEGDEEEEDEADPAYV